MTNPILELAVAKAYAGVLHQEMQALARDTMKLGAPTSGALIETISQAFDKANQVSIQTGLDFPMSQGTLQPPIMPVDVESRLVMAEAYLAVVLHALTTIVTADTLEYVMADALGAAHKARDERAARRGV